MASYSGYKKSRKQDVAGSSNDSKKKKEYVEQEVVNHRYKNGSLEYLIKSSEFKWEAKKNLDCTYEHLIKAYEYKRKKKIADKGSSSEDTDSGSEIDPQPCGFEHGLEPEEIIGAVEDKGVLKFLMKWKGSQEMELVTAKEANKRCPKLVNHFYNERLSF